MVNALHAPLCKVVGLLHNACRPIAVHAIGGVLYSEPIGHDVFSGFHKSHPVVDFDI